MSQGHVREFVGLDVLLVDRWESLFVQNVFGRWVQRSIRRLGFLGNNHPSAKVARAQTDTGKENRPSLKFL
jgi:hypothetical protein